MVSWVSDASGFGWNASIYAQRYDADGAAVGSEILINANVTGNAPPAVTALADGGYILTWNDGTAAAIYAQRFDGEGNAWGAPAQQITGTAGDNVITGGARSQSLIGLDGDDNLRGGGDDDILNGGSGNDMLTGGAGTDTYVFDSALGDGGDRVFSFGPRDRIELDDAVFDMLDAGTLARANFRANAVGNARDGGDYILYNTTNGNLYYDADGDGAGVAIKFAKLVGAPALTALDFEIV